MKASLASRRTSPSFGILGTDLFRHPELMALRTFILLTIASTSALGAEFEPANFGKYEARFVGSIKFPEGSEDVDLALRCASPVSERGQVGRISCAFTRQPKVDQAFINAITTKRSHLRIRIEPARAKRLRKTVRFQYTVRFERDAEGSRISVFPNHGHAMAEHGLNYTSPQRYENARGKLWRWCKQVFEGRISGFITREGLAEDVKIEADGSPSPRCIESIATDFEKSKYIPAFVDGSPIETRLVQSYWDDTPSRQLYVDVDPLKLRTTYRWRSVQVHASDPVRRQGPFEMTADKGGLSDSNL